MRCYGIRDVLEFGSTWGQPGALAGAAKNLEHHGRGELARVGILQRRMIAGEQPAVSGNGVLDAMAEDPIATAIDLTGAEEMGDNAVKADLAQTDDGAHLRQRGDLFVEKGCALRDFLGQRFVGGGRAADDGGDPCIVELHSIVAMGGCGL